MMDAYGEKVRESKEKKQTYQEKENVGVRREEREEERREEREEEYM